MLLSIHHAAIICSDYAVSKRFYTETLGLAVIAEHYRESRQSYKLDLALPDGGQIELFSFPDAPLRPSRPEAQGLRHLAFAVDDVAACKAELEANPDDELAQEVRAQLSSEPERYATYTREYLGWGVFALMPH